MPIQVGVRCIVGGRGRPPLRVLSEPVRDCKVSPLSRRCRDIPPLGKGGKFLFRLVRGVGTAGARSHPTNSIEVSVRL